MWAIGDKLQKEFRLLYYFCVLFAVMWLSLPLFHALGHWDKIPLFANIPIGMSGNQFISTIEPSERLLCLAVSLLPFVLLSSGVWCLGSVFNKFSKSNFFTQRNYKRLKWSGSSMIWSWILLVAGKVFVNVTLVLPSAQKTALVYLDINTLHELLLPLFGVLLVGISHVFKKAISLEDEVNQFV